MLLIIACGNSLRQDDGAGLFLAQRLADKWLAAGWPVRYLAVQQLVPELALEMARPEVDQVLFVDTRLAVDERDTAVRIQMLDFQVNNQCIGHQLNPAVLVAYAQTLFDRQPNEKQIIASQITIPGFHFNHSENLSEPCLALLDQAVEQSLHDLNELFSFRPNR